jgi:mannose-6-phosphate isomerase-like protein (cupin superfamily)
VRHVPPSGGKTLWVFGGLVTFLALGEETGGAFTLFEEATSPGSSAFPHLHHGEDQAFYVLDGEYAFECGGRAFGAKPGSFVYVPRGSVHSFENVGTKPGRLLILSAPAGGTEAFFFEVGEPATDRSSPPASTVPEGFEGIAKIREIARKHGSDIDALALLRQLSADPAGSSERR